MSAYRRLAGACSISLVGCARPVDRKTEIDDIQGAVARQVPGQVSGQVIAGVSNRG
jgi:hypothetical protein